MSSKAPGLSVVLITVLCNALSSGVIFGWPNLIIILLENGIYADRCVDDDCSAQTFRLSLIFIVGVTGAECAGITLGVYLDKRNPKECGTISLLLSAIGHFLFAISAQYGVDAYAIAYGLMGLGGGGFQLACINLSNLFPARKAAIVASYIAGYSLSQLTSLVFLYIYESGVSLSSIYYFYGAFMLVEALFAFLFLPWRSFHIGETYVVNNVLPWNKNKLNPVEKIEDPVSAPEAGSTTPAGETELGNEITTETTDGHSIHAPSPYSELPLKEQLLTKTFGLLCFFVIAQLFFFEFYITTAQNQLELMGDAEHDYFYAKSFNIIGSLGFLSIPVFSLLADHHGYKWTFLLNCVACIIFPIPPLIKSLPPQFISFVVWAIARQFIFSNMYGFVGLKFGFKNYGQIVGIITFGYAIVAQAQYGVIYFILYVLEGSYFWWNVLNIIVSASLFVYPFYLWKNDPSASAVVVPAGAAAVQQTVT